jgi:hypothetical protein
MLSFELFTIGVGEFAYEMFFIASFSPGLGNLSPNRARRTAYLVGKRLHFFSGETFGEFKDFSCHGTGFFVNHQIPEAFGMP